MTREEEIKKQAENKALEPSRLMHPYANQYKVMSAYEIGFIEGAVWADAHPVVKVGGALKNYERGYEEAIDKACELLYEYNRKQINKMFGTVHTADVTINVADFRKAMKGEPIDACYNLILKLHEQKLL